MWNRISLFVTLHESFQAKFEGPTIRLLRNSLKGYYAEDDSNIYYDRVIPMVNSSGLGKSKLVYELGRQVFERNHHNS